MVATALIYSLARILYKNCFENYGGATPLQALPVRAKRTLHPDPYERFTEKHLPDVNPPTGTRKYARKICTVCMDKKEWKGTKYRCNECNVSLCPVVCFQIYHSLQDQ